MLNTQTISELWESSTGTMWPRAGKFTAGSNQQTLIDFAESIQKVASQKQSLRDIIAISQLAALTSVYWETDTANEFTSVDALIKCQCETAYEYADMMLLECNKKKTTNNTKEPTNEINIINAV